MNVSFPSAPGRLTMLAEGIVGSPRVSGNGKVVVWDQMVGDNLEIMRWKDGKVDQITHDVRVDMRPVVSKKGDVLAWTRFSSPDPNDSKGRWEIHQWRNGKESTVAAGPSDYFDCAVSGDGQVLAWDNDGDGRMANWNVERQTVGGPVEKVTTGPGYHADPLLDAHGRNTFWSNADSGHLQVWTQGPDGVNHAVAPSKGNQILPSVTPDAHRLVFVDDSQPFNTIVQVHDGQPRVAIQEPKVDEFMPAESANGKHLAWSRIDRTVDPSPMEICLQDPHQTLQVTDKNGGLNAYPTMSDNGKTVVWMWVDPNNINHCRVYRLDRE